MDNQKLTTIAASGAASLVTTDGTDLLPIHLHQVLQNFLLIWLDASFNETQEGFKKSIQYLRSFVTSITTFTNADECVSFLSKIKEEKVFMIVSGSLGPQIIPDIQAWPQLDSVYVSCDNKSVHEQWVKAIPKVRGVYTQMEAICEALKADCERCDRAMIPISFNEIDPLFMYTQLLKDTLLEIEYDDTKSVKELVDYCRLQDKIQKDEIDEVEHKYFSYTPIWWYTAPYFMYSMLNRALRLMEVDIILKMGFFIQHLHKHIETLGNEQQSTSTALTGPFPVFRGQGLSLKDFEKMKTTKGGLMSFNNFLSTSRNRNVSLKSFALPASRDPNSVGILFVMTIDPTLCATSSIPFVDVKEVGFFKGKEEEILFSTHTIFRIDRIEPVEDDQTGRLWQVNLTLIGNNNHDLNALTEHIREELNLKAARGWSRLAFILIKIGEASKAEQLYKILLEKASSNKDRADYNLLLGSVYDDMGEYSKALSYYERALDIREKVLSPNHPDLALCYNNIGSVYANMGKYSEALLYYEKDLKISQQSRTSIHPNLAISYHNIGNVYAIMGEYSKALSSYEQALAIDKAILPENHPELATSYMNIGAVYDRMGEYSKALSFHEISLEIKIKALPPNHPDLACSYNNVGVVHFNMGEYSKALSYYEKDLDISQKNLPSTHPHILESKKYIEMVKKRL
ncbi:unnamed protein product [Rotaria sp. Silwood1]|nr:unnamed protein product [Rotaria sp. Silwood1]